MSNNTLQSALVSALQSTQSAESSALSLIAEHSGKVLFDQRQPSLIVEVSRKVKTDQSRVVVEYDAIDYIDHDAAVETLRAYGDICYSLSSVCGSLISDFLMSDRRSQSAATDSKLWKAVKVDCEKSLDLPDGYQFPSQWQQYFSDVKKALEVGFLVSHLQTLGDDGVKRVKARSALRAFISAMKEKTAPTTIEDRISASLSKLGDSYLSESSFDPQSISLDNGSKEAVKAIALANIGRTELLESLGAIPESGENLIRQLIDDGYADLMVKMGMAYLNSQTQIKAA